MDRKNENGEGMNLKKFLDIRRAHIGHGWPIGIALSHKATTKQEFKAWIKKNFLKHGLDVSWIPRDYVPPITQLRNKNGQK